MNAAWMDSFVRQYDQVDINLVIGEGSSLQAPVLRNVGARGLSSISQEVSLQPSLHWIYPFLFVYL